MRPGLHRYHPDLHPARRLPAFRVVRSHRRPRSGWPPWAAASVMILLGLSAVVLTLAASRGPAVHHHLVRLPGIVQPAAPESVASDPPVDQGDDQNQGQQRGDDQASRSTPRPTSTGIADPPLAPAPGAAAATAPASADSNPLLLPVPTSPPPMVVPSPTPSSTGPGCGRKPPHPTRSPKAQIVSGNALH